MCFTFFGPKKTLLNFVIRKITNGSKEKFKHAHCSIVQLENGLENNFVNVGLNHSWTHHNVHSVQTKDNSCKSLWSSTWSIYLCSILGWSDLVLFRFLKTFTFLSISYIFRNSIPKNWQFWPCKKSQRA